MMRFCKPGQPRSNHSARRDDENDIRGAVSPEHAAQGIAEGGVYTLVRGAVEQGAEAHASSR